MFTAAAARSSAARAALRASSSAPRRAALIPRMALSTLARVAAPSARVGAVAATPRLAAAFARSYASGAEALTVQQIEDRTLQVLRDFDKVDAAKLSLDAHWINDLGLDSLDQVEITMALEDEFSVEIPDREAEAILTARQAVETIHKDKHAM